MTVLEVKTLMNEVPVIIGKEDTADFTILPCTFYKRMSNMEGYVFSGKVEEN